MKPGSSTLNPHASSYIPLSKRVVYQSKDFNLLLESQNESEVLWLGDRPSNTQGQLGNVSSSYFPNAGAFQAAVVSKWKDHNGGGVYASSSFYERSNSDEESDMDMAYLQMEFPGISVESICEAYLANRGDLDATVDMLNHLEVTFLITDFLNY
ncbi:polyadenylate-binding protein-interacting protein 5 [Dorcoceras hygrometricum]|uniref:Polyadenylate-binding protein-interacting protein 5 n=1 Tax=Dorcoceras hygrometricum TaxID=472368 RepID=A0A2Z7BKL8_9LAMI|nr:polyadenylate-binding protein-interacting protein 5 [Dorcoceras hygrometricum]